MTHRIASPAPNAPRRRDAGGFTLIEILVAVGIIALLIGVLVPTLGGARTSAVLAGEQADARSIAQAYAAFASDNRGYVLPAKVDSNKFPDAVLRAPATLPTGEAPTGPDASRWIWRLGQYVDFAFPTLIRDRDVLAEVNDGGSLAGIDAGTYRASVFTGFGMNSYYLGGRREFYETNSQGVNRFQALFGADFFIRRMDQAPSPASLLAFVSAASNIGDEGFREGYFYVEPPRTTITQTSWFDFTAPTKERVKQESGWYGAFPVGNGKAVVNFLDGHAEQLVWDDLIDMRRWSPQANAPDWSLPRPTGN
ncbi:MAG: type II secretion system protein [Phycisphaerales bacterium]